MIISRSPLRVSFVGGGSDIKSFCFRYPGAVVSTAIDKFIYVVVNKRFDDTIRVSYSKTEIVKKVEDLEHELVKESMKLVGLDGGIEIVTVADVPSKGTGLGSSSAVTVGLLNALHAFKGEYCSPKQLAEEASKIEIDIVGKPIGKQDQYASAFGGFNFIQFNKDNSVFVEPIICKPEIKQKLNENLLMFHTGIFRKSHDILSKQSKNMLEDKEIFEKMKQMVSLTGKMKKAISNENLDDFGKLLHENWLLKKQMASTISNDLIEKSYEKALRAGALGGKVLGAGGGGFLLFYCEKEHQSKLRRALAELKEMPFNINAQGSTIIYVGWIPVDIKQNARDYLDDLKKAIDSIDLKKVEKVIQILSKAFDEEKQIFVLGNGGSASIASHFAVDLGKGTLQNIYDDVEKRFKVMALTDNVSTITAYANDLGYEDIFAQQLKNLVKKGDVVIGISSSGNSKNVLKAIELAKKEGATTIGLIGFDGGKLKDLVDESIIVESRHYGRVEDSHLALQHLICAILGELKYQIKY